MIDSLGTDPGSKHMPSQPKRNAWVGWGWFWGQEFFVCVCFWCVEKELFVFFLFVSLFVCWLLTGFAGRYRGTRVSS